MYFHLDLDAKILGISSQAASFFGKEVVEMVGKSFKEFLSPETAEAFERITFENSDFPNQLMLTLIGSGKTSASGMANLVRLDTASAHREVLIHIVIRDWEYEPSLEKYANRMAKVGAWEFHTGFQRTIWTDELFAIHEVPKGSFSSMESMIDKYHPNDQIELRQALNDCIAHGTPFDLDLRVVAKGNHDKWVQVVGHSSHSNGPSIVSGIVRDISGSKRLENILLKNNIFLKTLFEVGKSISRSKSKWTLSSEISQIIMAETGYQWVWFNLKSDEIPPQDESVSSVSTDGFIMEDLFELHRLENLGPVKLAIEKSEIQVVADITQYKDSPEWQAYALQKGFKSFIALPFFYDDELYGTLNIYCSNFEKFDSEQLYFLNRIGADFAFAIHNLEIKAQKMALNDFNELLINSLNALSFDIDIPKNEMNLAGSLLDAGESGKVKMDLTEVVERIHPVDVLHFRHQIEGLALAGDYFDKDIRLMGSKGKYNWLNLIGRLYRNADGQIERVAGISLNINEKKNSEARQMMAEIRGQDDERKRISTELHDSLGQTLTVAKMNLNQLLKNDKLHERERELMQMAFDMVQRAQTESREISHALMPASLVDFGLVRSIESDIKRLSLSSEIVFSFYSDLRNERFDFTLESNIYNIVREAINNIIKHSHATSAHVSLTKNDQNLTVHIEDNGTGIISTNSDGHGLRNMENRVKSLGGELFIESLTGTTITINVSLADMDSPQFPPRHLRVFKP